MSTTQPGPGLLFTYHGGSIDLGFSVAVYNNFAAGPTTVKMTGDSFSGKGQMNLTASIREGSTAYLDFKTLLSLDNWWQNFQSVTFPATSTVSLGKGYVINSDIFFDGPVSFKYIFELRNGRLWFDDIDHATIPTYFTFASGESGLNVKDSVATSGHDILLDDSFVNGPYYVGFDTKVMSINISGNDQGNTVLEVVTSRSTYHLIINHHLYGFFLPCVTSKNFQVVQKTLDRNGTSVTLDAVMFKPGEFFVCPNAETSTVTDSTSFPGCTKYVSYAEAHDYYGNTRQVVLGSSSTCSFFTTTVSKDRLVEVDIITYYIASDDTGQHVATKTITVKVEEPDYTTTYTSDGHTITEVVSHITTTDSDRKTVTITTTMASFAQVDEGVFTSPEPYSQPPVVTSTVTEDDGSSKTVVISYFPSEGEDGVTRTGTTTVSTITPAEVDYTTTIDKGNGEFETDLVSHITTKDSNGNPTTIITTIPLKPSDGGEADYTSVFVSDGHTITKIVTHVTTSDSLGHTIVLSSTYLTYDRVDDGAVFYSPSVSVSSNVSRSVDTSMVPTGGSGVSSISSSNSRPSSNPTGSNSGSKPSSNTGGSTGNTNGGPSSGSNPGSNSGSNSDSNGSSNSGTNGGSNSGTQPGSNPGSNSGTNSGTNSGSNSGSNSGTKPGSNAGSNSASNSASAVRGGSGSGAATVSVSSSYIGSVFHGDAAQRGANFVSFAIAGLVMALF